MFQREIKKTNSPIIGLTLAITALAGDCMFHHIDVITFITHVEGVKKLSENLITYERIRQEALAITQEKYRGDEN